MAKSPKALKATPQAHIEFAKAVSHACAEKKLPCNFKATKKGFIIFAGKLGCAWHRSQNPWRTENIRNLGLKAELKHYLP